jgi:hypothetical protein
VQGRVEVRRGRATDGTVLGANGGPRRRSLRWISDNDFFGEIAVIAQSVALWERVLFHAARQNKLLDERAKLVMLR